MPPKKSTTKTKSKKIPVALVRKVKRYNADRAKLAKMESDIMKDASKHGLGLNWRR
jgi:uncharacterized protein (UPF0335 family)